MPRWPSARPFILPHIPPASLQLPTAGKDWAGWVSPKAPRPPAAGTSLPPAASAERVDPPGSGAPSPRWAEPPGEGRGGRGPARVREVSRGRGRWTLDCLGFRGTQPPEWTRVGGFCWASLQWREVGSCEEGRGYKLGGGPGAPSIPEPPVTSKRLRDDSAFMGPQFTTMGPAPGQGTAPEPGDAWNQRAAPDGVSL
ncbi:translation initiation factor IF-2-like [Cebus imitator]|uniref:translation initiation factor IF-2-like n=1 Tax=Cebus imitator TaxID=2715852 RepID=UPI0018999979|nr:translation initiation factor IF-2-like [Cebus imitator]